MSLRAPPYDGAFSVNINVYVGVNKIRDGSGIAPEILIWKRYKLYREMYISE